MEMVIKKGKLRKGKSYALRSAILQRALDEAGVDIYISLNFSGGSQFFSATYILPNPRINYERFFISTGSVDSSDAKAAKEYMETKVVPEFIEWAMVMLKLPAESTKLSLEMFDGPKFL